MYNNEEIVTLGFGKTSNLIISHFYNSLLTNRPNPNGNGEVEHCGLILSLIFTR